MRVREAIRRNLVETGAIHVFDENRNLLGGIGIRLPKTQENELCAVRRDVSRKVVRVVGVGGEAHGVTAVRDPDAEDASNSRSRIIEGTEDPGLVEQPYRAIYAVRRGAPWQRRRHQLVELRPVWLHRCWLKQTALASAGIDPERMAE